MITLSRTTSRWCPPKAASEIEAFYRRHAGELPVKRSPKTGYKIAWREYFGYRPPSLGALRKPPDTKAMADSYHLWIAERDREPPVKPPVPDPPRVNVLMPARETPKPVEVIEASAEPEPVPEIARRRDAAALLRELAASYGPRRAHKLRAMADFIEAPAVKLRVVG